MTTPITMAPIRILDEAERYRIVGQIGHGGMGYVYQAIDTKLYGRQVAIKTLRDRPTEESLAMFKREIGILARLDDDNIVSILNIGECEQDRIRKPYLVMPFLEGQTLEDLIAKRERVPVDRCVRTILQVCHGLQAARAKDVIHRDIKPSNIFLCLNGKVKIIDFGLARLVDTRSSSGRKGTLRYMSPEQIRGDEIDHRTDLFSLGVVLYELLTNIHPFGLDSELEADFAAFKTAIEHARPALIKDINPDVSDALCCLVHRALQRDRRFRFQSAADMAEDLEKVLRNEPLDYGNLDKIEPLLQETRTSLEQGKLDEASDILDQVEARGHWHPRIEQLREEIHRARTAEKLARLLQQANEYIHATKYELALNCLRRALAEDPENSHAKSLMVEVVRRLEDRDIASLLESAAARLEDEDFDGAEQMVNNVLKSRPELDNAVQLSKKIAQLRVVLQDRKLQEEAVYAKTIKAFQSGNISTAFRSAEELARLADFDKHPDPRYADIYTKVRSTHDYLLRKYDEAEKLMEVMDRKNLQQAIQVCEDVLKKHPNDIGFRALLTRIKHREMEVRSAEVAAVIGKVNSELDLERKVEILEQALQDHPNESRLVDAVQNAKDLGLVIKPIVDAARELERQQDFEGAEGHYETLKRIYPAYPALDFHIARLQKRRQEQLKQNARDCLIEEVRRCLAEGVFEQALHLIGSSEEFREESEFEQLRNEAELGLRRRGQVEELLRSAALHVERREFGAAISLLEQASRLDPRNGTAQALLVDNLYQEAGRQLDLAGWRTAHELLVRLLTIDRNHERAKALLETTLDRKREEYVDQVIPRAIELSAENPADALKVLEEALHIYPGERRLSRLQEEYRKLARDQVRQKSVGQLHAEVEALRKAFNYARADERIVEVLAEYPDEPQLLDLLAVVRKELAEQRRKEWLAGILDHIESLEKEGTLSAMQKALAMAVESLNIDANAVSIRESRERLEKKIDQAKASLANYELRIKECIHQQDFENALKLIGEALEIDSGSRGLGVLRIRVRVQSKLASLLKALKRSGSITIPKPALRVFMIVALVSASIAVAYAGYRFLFRPRLPGTLQLTINSEPSGAAVYVQNQRRGTTPFTGPIEASTIDPRISIKISLPEYLDHEAVLTLEPNRTEYNLSTVTLTRRPPSSAEEAYELARQSHDRLLLASFETDEFLLEVDQFVGIVNQIPEQESDVRQRALDLKGKVKTDLLAKFGELTPRQRGSDRGRKLLDAINRVDPDDPEIVKLLGQFPEMVNQLKSQVAAAIQKKLFLSSDTGGAMVLVNRLANNFPSEQAYSRQQRAAIRTGVLALVREKCGLRTEECEDYVRRAQADFRNDRDIQGILDGAQQLPRPVVTPPTGPGTLINTALEGSMKEASSRMESALAERRYVLPADNSCSRFAARVLEISNEFRPPYAPSAEARQLVARATDLGSECLRLATAVADRLVDRSMLTGALDSRDKATQVVERIEESRRIHEAVLTGGNSPESAASMNRLKGWQSELNRLLERSEYPVTHEHTLGSCSGTLTVSGFSIEYSSPERSNDNLQAGYDSAQITRDGDSFSVRRANRTWKLRSREGDGPAKIQQALDEFQKIRASIRAISQ